MGRHGKQNAMNFDVGASQLGSMDNLDRVVATNRFVMHPRESRRSRGIDQDLRPLFDWE